MTSNILQEKNVFLALNTQNKIKKDKITYQKLSGKFDKKHFSMINNQQANTSNTISANLTNQQQYFEQNITLNQSQSYKNNLFNEDPILCQLSKQLDLQAQMSKKIKLSQTFPIRFKQLIDTQKRFKQYQKLHLQYEHSVKLKQNQSQQKIQELNDQVIYLKQEINKKDDQLQIKIKQFKSQLNEAQLKAQDKRKNIQSQLIKAKSMIQHINQSVIKTLTAKLNESLEESLNLKDQNIKLTIELNSQYDKIKNISFKFQQTIQILQENLTLSQKQKNNYTEILQKVSQSQQMNLKQVQKNKQQLRNLNSKLQLKNHQFNEIIHKYNQLKQKSQQQIHQQKIKYLQELRQKNSIIDQFQQVKQQYENIYQQLKQTKTKYSQKQTQNYLNIQQMNIYKQKLLSQSSQNNKNNLYLTDQCNRLTLSLKNIQVESSDKIKNLLQQNFSLKQSLQTLTYKYKTQQTQYSQILKQFNKLKEISTNKQSQFIKDKQQFIKLAQQLQIQLQKAKQIIKSKNIHINQLRNQINYFKSNQVSIKIDKQILFNEYQDLKKNKHLQISNLTQEIQLLKLDHMSQIKQLKAENNKNISALGKLEFQAIKLSEKLTVKQKQHQQQFQNLHDQLKIISQKQLTIMSLSSQITKLQKSLLSYTSNPQSYCFEQVIDRLHLLIEQKQLLCQTFEKKYYQQIQIMNCLRIDNNMLGDQYQRMREQLVRIRTRNKQLQIELKLKLKEQTYLFYNNLHDQNQSNQLKQSHQYKVSSSSI